MCDSNSPQCKLLAFPEPRQNAVSQAKDWIDGILASNDHLRAALEFLRGSYCAMMAGLSVKDAEEVLAQVDAILKGANRSRRNAFLARSRAATAGKKKGALSENDAKTS
jgi:hypothetical protein